tara:strand:- start:16559 stop:17908 length:1350 start_codon:yes stop_codon:yes gene_type:complete
LEAQFGDQLDTFGVGYFRVSADNSAIEEANDTLLTLIGVDSSEASHVPLSRFLQSDDQRIFRETILKLNDDGAAAERLDLPVVSTTDQPTWLRFKFAVHSGSHRGIHAIALDITARKNLEHQHVQTIQKFEVAQSRAMIGSWELPQGATRGWWSRQMFDLHSLNPDHGIPTVDQFMDQVHPEDRPRLAEAQAADLRPNDVLRIEFRSNPSLGPIRYFVSNVYIENVNGQPRRQGTTQDITQQKQIVEALDESERRYREIVESASEGIVVASSKGIIAEINEPGAKMLGFEVDEIVGRSMWDFIDDESRPEAAKKFQRRAKGISEVHETKLLHRSGRTVWLLVSSCPMLDSEGNFIAVRATMIDITDRKKIEEISRNSMIARARLEMLSPRERSVLKHVVAGRMNKVIANRLDISEKSVERHRSNLMKKLSVKSVAELVRIAVAAETVIR